MEKLRYGRKALELEIFRRRIKPSPIKRDYAGRALEEYLAPLRTPVKKDKNAENESSQ